MNEDGSEFGVEFCAKCHKIDLRDRKKSEYRDWHDDSYWELGESDYPEGYYDEIFY